MVGKDGGARLAVLRASAWSGYRASSFELRLDGERVVSLDSLFRMPFGIALKQLLVWQLPLFKYFSILCKRTTALSNRGILLLIV